MKPSSLLAGSALAAAVNGASVQLDERPSPLDVKIEMVGNSLVKASVTNNGLSALKLFKTGSILGEHVVEKTEIFSAGSKIDFDGLRFRMATQDLPEEDFKTLAAGETVEATFDVAEAHDLSGGGAFDIVSKGAISYAEEGSVDIAGAIPFASNAITAKIDGVQADDVRKSFHSKAKRQILQADCTGAKLNVTSTALVNCATLALKAQEAAASGPAAKVEEYFRSSNNETRTTVATVFKKIVTECGQTTAGVSRQYCTDVYQSCSRGVLAYTMPSRSFMVNCALYFNALPALAPLCHAQDQATTTLHETTHLTQVKGTQDYGVYGYKGLKQLSVKQVLNHADAYALFANAIYMKC